MHTYTIHPKSYRSFSIYQDETLLVSVIFPSFIVAQGRGYAQQWPILAITHRVVVERYATG
jgi:hypothetical protein